MLFWILFLILVVTVYAVMIVCALPKLMLKTKYPVSSPTDRGLKKYKFSDDDYAVVYEPSLAARKYVTQYMLIKKDGQKTFKCKLASGVTYVDFDIMLFNGQGKCFLVINSKDIAELNGITPEVELPDETAYASIIINQVDGKVLGKAQRGKVGKFRLLCFALLALLLSACMSVCSMVSFSNIFGGLFRETFADEMLSSGWVFIFPTSLCAVCITFACIVLSRNSKR